MADYGKKVFANQQLTPYILLPEQPDAVKGMWLILRPEPSSVAEFRGLWPNGLPNRQPPRVLHFRAANYSSMEAFKAAAERAVLALNVEGYNVYMVMNPIRPDFTGSEAVTDQDITLRRVLLIDIDRTGNTKDPATDAEVDAARSLAEKVKAYLEHRDWPDPVTVMSGNGYHLYYPLFLANDAEATATVKSTLHSLNEKFKNNVVGIDTVVYNAARITKVPGTVMRKGTATDERPYRMAEVRHE